MKLPLPSLTALRAFESAARFQSFSRAAEELSVTHGAVSRQVAALERELGVALFDRSHGVVRLTQAGLQLRDEVTSAFLRLSEATEKVRDRPRGSRTVRLSAPPAFSVRWLIPRLSVFQRRHPQLDVSLASSVAPVDFAAGGYDLAIRLLPRKPAAGHAVRLFGETSIPVCHADLLPRGKAPVDLPCLLRASRLIRVAAEPRGWARWAANRRVDVSGARFLDVELTYLSVQATLEGLGVALLPLALVADDIARGVLVAPLGVAPIDDTSYFVLAAAAPAPRSAAARCIDWLQAEGAESMRVAAEAIAAA
ncbi:MAG TPA: LysR substrate-binding domain-containing protein [Ramlibacter sp.]|nr:LysR substrate-binding domain-containing protein [Ramlibacter sp.]